MDRPWWHRKDHLTFRRYRAESKIAILPVAKWKWEYVMFWHLQTYFLFQSLTAVTISAVQNFQECLYFVCVCSEVIDCLFVRYMVFYVYNIYGFCRLTKLWMGASWARLRSKRHIWPSFHQNTFSKLAWERLPGRIITSLTSSCLLELVSGELLLLSRKLQMNPKT